MITNNNKLYQYASSNMNSILIRYTEFKDPDENKTNADILDVSSAFLFVVPIIGVYSRCVCVCLFLHAGGMLFCSHIGVYNRCMLCVDQRTAKTTLHVLRLLLSPRILRADVLPS